jgi:Glyoxalase-like domain
MHEIVTLDHLVCIVPDLQAGSAELGAALGMTLTAGGVHPGHGTSNTLLSLGTGRYLELLGADPNAPQREGIGARAAAASGFDIWTFSVGSRDLDGLARRARAVGLEVPPTAAGARTTPAGDALRWRGMYLLHPLYAGLVPFAIDWQDSPHPSVTSAQGTQLRSLFVTHPEPEGLRAIYLGIGLDIAVHYGPRRAIVATLAHGERLCTLVGDADGLF